MKQNVHRWHGHRENMLEITSHTSRSGVNMVNGAGSAPCTGSGSGRHLQGYESSILPSGHDISQGWGVGFGIWEGSPGAQSDGHEPGRNQQAISGQMSPESHGGHSDWSASPVSQMPFPQVAGCGMPVGSGRTGPVTSGITGPPGSVLSGSWLSE